MTRRKPPASKGYLPGKDPDRMTAGALFPVHKKRVTREIVTLHRLYLLEKETFLAIELSTLPPI